MWLMLDNFQKFKLKKQNTCLNLPKLSRGQVEKIKFFKVEFCKLKLLIVLDQTNWNPCHWVTTTTAKLWFEYCMFILNHIMVLNEFWKENSTPT